MARAGLIAVRVLRRPDGAAPGSFAVSVPATGLTIGRAPECDLVLDDPLRLVSRQHARLAVAEDGSTAVHCISATLPMTVDDAVVPPGGERIVRPGQRLRIGGFELQVESAEPAASIAVPHERPPAAVPAPLPTPQPPPREERRRAAPVATKVPTAEPSPGSKAPAPAPAPAHAAAVVAHTDEPAARSRIDQWFDLDNVADPWAPGSALPVAPSAAPPARAVSLDAPPAMAVTTSAAVQADAETAPRVDPPAGRARRTSPATKADPLMRAFLAGAGMASETKAELPLAVDAAFMEHLGAVLRASTEGTLALLRSRALTKRSIRAEGTRIAPRENNPLKFAPNAAEALALLIDPDRAQGFLAPIAAVRDAHDDLLVHQLAMVAGMRAAAFELIHRMGPDVIEAEHGPSSGLPRWVPALRDAALWRRHRAHHAHVMAHLDDDFEAVFGREFLLAYEAQSRLAASSRESDAGAGPGV